MAVLRRRAGRPAMPDGLAPAPGPMLLTATRFSGSPHGPFLELAVAEPARLGSRFGWCRTTVVVDRPDVQRDTRVRWGYPATLGRLEWSADGDLRSLTWLDRGLRVTGSVRRPAVPWAAPQRALQQRGQENVVAHARLRGLAHPCRVQVDAIAGSMADVDAEADPLAAMLAGRHLGAVLTGLHSRWQPARSPAVVQLGRRTASHPEPVMLKPSSRSSA